MANIVFTYQAPGLSTSVSIDMRHGSGGLVAPAQISLRAIDYEGLADAEYTGSVYEPEHHEYDHEWTINGEPLAAFTKPALVAEHNNPNVMFGREVGFCLPEAGTYTFRLVVTDRLGNAAVAFSEEVTVADKFAHYPEAQRIYVDPEGVWSGVPAASVKYQTLEQLRAALTSHNSVPMLLLLRAEDGEGVFHTLEGVNAAANVNGRDNLFFAENNQIQMIATYGTGMAVVRQGTDTTRDARVSMFTIKYSHPFDWKTLTNIQFEGDYDPETWHGHNMNSFAVSIDKWLRGGADGFLTIHNIKTVGCGGGITSGTNAADFDLGFRVMVADCEIDGWAGYGFFGGAPTWRLSWIGNYVHQRPETPTYGAQDGFAPNHGPFRFAYGYRAHISMNRHETRGGWDGNDQSCLRVFPSSTTDQWAHIDRNVLIGGWDILHLRRSSQGEALPFNVVVERNSLVATGTTGTFVHCQRSGFTFRTNVMTAMDAPRKPNINHGTTIFLEPDTIDKRQPDNPSNPIVIHGNSYYNAMSAANDGNYDIAFVTNQGGYFTNLHFENMNNLIHKPNGNNPKTAAAPVSVATLPGMSINYLGLRNHFKTLEFTLDGAVLIGEDLIIPYTDIDQSLMAGETLGGATDQAYWLANAGTDDDHQIYARPLEGGNYRRYRGFSKYGTPPNLAVAFNSDHVAITNNTHFDWHDEMFIGVLFDRRSRAPAVDPTYAYIGDIMYPRPGTGSPALTLDTGVPATPKDFLLAERGASPVQGALQPV